MKTLAELNTEKKKLLIELNYAVHPDASSILAKIQDIDGQIKALRGSKPYETK